MEVHCKVYTYHTEVKWTEQRKGVISCAGKPDIQVATPRSSKDTKGIWSPEDLFVASITLSANADAAKARELIEKAEANWL